MKIKTKMYNFSQFQNRKSFALLMKIIISAQDIKKAKTIFLNMPDTISDDIYQENREYMIRITISQLSEAGKILETIENIINKEEINWVKKDEKINLSEYQDITYIINNTQYESKILYENALSLYKMNKNYIKLLRNKITFHYDNHNEILDNAIKKLNGEYFSISRSENIHEWDLGPGAKIISLLMREEFMKQETRSFFEIIKSIEDFSESFLIFSGEFIWDYLIDSRA